MRILFVLTYYYPHWTGLTAYARRIAEGLAARGHEVHALATQHDPALPLEEVHAGVHIHRVAPSFRVSRSDIALGLLPRLNTLLDDMDAMSIHIPFPEVLPVTALARKKGVSVFITHNGDLILPGGPLKRPLEWLYYEMTGAAGRIANGVIPQTRDYAASSRLLAPLDDKLSFIYAPVDQPPPDEEAVATWRSELGLDGKLLVGFAGRFVREKGFDFLLDAVTDLSERLPNVHFVFAGEQEIPYEQFFQQHQRSLEAHADRFTMLGLITDDQTMANFYGLIDIFALPSRSDCFPSTQIEAVRAGTPLVTADIPGAREIVRVTGMGVIVPAQDSAGLADGIVEVATHLEDYRARHAQALAIFDPERCFEAYEALFEASLTGQAADSADDLTSDSAGEQAADSNIDQTPDSDGAQATNSDKDLTSDSSNDLTSHPDSDQAASSELEET